MLRSPCALSGSVNHGQPGGTVAAHVPPQGNAITGIAPKNTTQKQRQRRPAGQVLHSAKGSAATDRAKPIPPPSNAPFISGGRPNDVLTHSTKSSHQPGSNVAKPGSISRSLVPALPRYLPAWPWSLYGTYSTTSYCVCGSTAAMTIAEVGVVVQPACECAQC